MPTLKFKLLPQQKECVDSTAKETLMSGAWGCAKSTSICYAILKEACTDNAVILLCRKTYTSLRRTTLPTLLSILPKNSYKFNKIEQKITLNGRNSVIYMTGLDDIEKVRSMNCSFIAVDEASELTENDWMELLGRLRAENGSRRIIAATNPAAPSHFLYQRFFVDTNPTRKVIRATSLDNPYLPKDYIDQLKTMPKALYDRFVMGEWVALEKQVYKEFSRDKTLRVRTMGEFRDYLVSIDFGYTNPCAIGFFGIDGDSGLHLIEDYKKSGLLLSKIADKVEQYAKFKPTVIVDPSAPALIAEIKDRDMSVFKANNEKTSGISRMQDMMHKGRFTADPNCSEFVKEIENYCYDDVGEPVKINDHMMDLCRYACSFIEGLRVGGSKPVMLAYEDFVNSQ